VTIERLSETIRGLVRPVPGGARQPG
jgi:hypothetical protein